MCEFELPDVSLRCFVARQLLLRIYALSSVKFSGLKLWLCKKCDKYEVCLSVSPAESEKLSPSKLPPVNPVKVHPWRTPTTSASFLNSQIGRKWGNVLFSGKIGFLHAFLWSIFLWKLALKKPVRPVARKVAEASLLPHSDIELPTSRAVGAERMEVMIDYILSEIL